MDFPGRHRPGVVDSPRGHASLDHLVPRDRGPGLASASAPRALPWSHWHCRRPRAGDGHPPHVQGSVHSGARRVVAQRRSEAAPAAPELVTMATPGISPSARVSACPCPRTSLVATSWHASASTIDGGRPKPHSRCLLAPGVVDAHSSLVAGLAVWLRRQCTFGCVGLQALSPDGAHQAPAWQRAGGHAGPPARSR